MATSNPRVFFDVEIDKVPAGRLGYTILLELITFLLNYKLI
jgi:hypothetical protein